MESISLEQMASFLKVPILQKGPIKGFSVDSRTIKPGEVYVALQGAKVDGHQFLPEAKAKGAIAAIVAKSCQGLDFSLPLFSVNDPLIALQSFATHLLHHRKPRVVAVTGSVGKTTTKDFIASLLSSKYRVGASPGNSNSQVGVPLTILNHTKGNEEILVLEMGMTHAGQLTNLIQIAPPEVAVITTVALVHACNFNALEEISLAKAEILQHSTTKLGIINHDLPNLPEILQQGTCRKLTFSIHSHKADYFLDFQNANLVQARTEGLNIRLGKLNILGRHNLHNLLAATAVARYFDLSWEEINRAIPHLKLPDRRLQLINHKGILFLNDSYNAAEPSVKAALESLPTPEREGNKIAVLGGLRELGKFCQSTHQRIGEFALNHVDCMYCLGEECQPIYEVWKKAGKPVQLFKDRPSLVQALRENLKSCDVVLLKGANSKELWKILDEF